MSAGKLLKKFILIFSSAFIFFSCGFINLNKVEFTLPVSEYESFFQEEIFTIKSCYNLKKTQFENIISLKENNSSVVIDFDWIDERTLNIIPHTKWKKGANYLFEISGNCETVSDGSFTVDLVRHFYYGNKNEFFSIESYTKENFTEKNSPLEFIFNIPVSQKEVISAFSISPSCETVISFSQDNKTVTVLPKEKWPYNKTLKWTITRDALSETGYILNKEYSGYIETLKDTEIPELLTVCPVSMTNDTFLTSLELKDLLDNQPIGFIFSKEMDFSSIENNITFSPSVSGSFFEVSGDKKRFIFKPVSNYSLKEEYTLTVKNSLSDLSGNELKEDKNFFFTTKNNYLTVEKILVNGINLNKESPVEIPATSGTVFVQILFSSDITDTILAENSISTAIYFPMTGKTPVKESVTWNQKREIEIKYTNLSTASDIDNIYSVTVTGTSAGIKNSSGDFMEDSVCMRFIAR